MAASSYTKHEFYRPIPRRSILLDPAGACACALLSYVKNLGGPNNGHRMTTRMAVAALTVRIDSLYNHVNTSARMDHVCKRGYVQLLARRRKMLAYLKRKDFEIYRKVAMETGLR